MGPDFESLMLRTPEDTEQKIAMETEETLGDVFISLLSSGEVSEEKG